MKKQFTLGKDERLKSRKQIELLFKEGKNFSVFPFRVYYIAGGPELPMNEAEFLKFGVGVSSRSFKKAVDRNRIKRLAREAYRLHKNELKIVLEERNLHLNIFFIFTGKELPDFALIKEKTGVALNKLVKIIHENDSPDT